MACSSCHKKTEQPMIAPVTFDMKDIPLNANDIKVVDSREVRDYRPSDWPTGKHKLLIFFPEIWTPVCQTELGAINKWAAAFMELDCALIAACTDPALAIADWYNEEPLLRDLDCLTFSSYLLPARLGLIDQGRVKRSSVFIISDGQVVKQEHFPNVGRSFAELHRMLYGFTTGSYCAEGWQSPEDGFLVPPNGDNVQ